MSRSPDYRAAHVNKQSAERNNSKNRQSNASAKGSGTQNNSERESRTNLKNFNRRNEISLKSLALNELVDESRRQSERRATNGNIIALACGPLEHSRYVNEKIEDELLEFK